MSSVLMITIVLLISNDPTYWSLVFNVCCACATATFSYPDNLLICDWVVSSFFFHYNNIIVLIVTASVWWADASLAASRNFSVLPYCVLLRQINISLSLSLALSHIVCFCRSDWSHGSRPFTGLTCSSGFYLLVLYFNVLVIPMCGRQSWPALWSTLGRTRK